MLALAFIVFFTLVTVAVLRFADIPGLQHARTETTASTDASSEGGAAYAAANAARSDVTWNCGAAPGSDYGTLTMSDGSTVSYRNFGPCSPGNTKVNGPGGGHCLLCVLNETAVPPSTTTSPTTPVLNTFCASGGGKCSYALNTVGGDILVNGTIASGSSIKACETSTVCPGKARIGEIAGATPGTCPAPNCVPVPTTFPIAIPDPLQTIGDPAATVPVPTGCSSWQTCRPTGCTNANWDPASGCSAVSNGNSVVVLNPGVWSSITVTGGADVCFNPGTYVFTGSLSVAGSGSVFAPGTVTGNNCGPSSSGGATFYLTCPGGTVGVTTVAYQPCANTASHVGGSLGFLGTGQLTVSSVPCPSGQIVPNCPGYDGVAVLADPTLHDSGIAACITSGNNCVLSVTGTGKSFDGSVDVRSAGASITAGGSESIDQGFLISNSLYVKVNVINTSGLSLTGPGAFSSSGFGCNVLQLNTYPGPVTPTPNPAPVAIIQSQCLIGTTVQSGVVDFNYGQ